MDVNNDGFVVPGDALVIINELNNRTKIDDFGRLPQFRPADVAYYYDVTGDGYCTTAECIWIINYLNSVVSPEGRSFSPGRREYGLSSASTHRSTIFGWSDPAISANQQRTFRRAGVSGAGLSITCVISGGDSDQSSTANGPRRIAASIRRD